MKVSSNKSYVYLSAILKKGLENAVNPDKKIFDKSKLEIPKFHSDFRKTSTDEIYITRIPFSCYERILEGYEFEKIEREGSGNWGIKLEEKEYLHKNYLEPFCPVIPVEIGIYNFKEKCRDSLLYRKIKNKDKKIAAIENLENFFVEDNCKRNNSLNDDCKTNANDDLEKEIFNNLREYEPYILSFIPDEYKIKDTLYSKDFYGFKPGIAHFDRIFRIKSIKKEEQFIKKASLEDITTKFLSSILQKKGLETSRPLIY